MGWLLIPLLIIVGILAAAVARTMKTNYRIGSGMFKSSEYNLDEKDNISEKNIMTRRG